MDGWKTVILDGPSLRWIHSLARCSWQAAARVCPRASLARWRTTLGSNFGGTDRGIFAGTREASLIAPSCATYTSPPGGRPSGAKHTQRSGPQVEAAPLPPGNAESLREELTRSPLSRISRGDERPGEDFVDGAQHRLCRVQAGRVATKSLGCRPQRGHGTDTH